MAASGERVSSRTVSYRTVSYRTWHGLELAWRVVRKRRLLPNLLAPDALPFAQFAPPGHFYSPIPDLAEVRARAATIFERSARELPGIELEGGAQLALLAALGEHAAEFPYGAAAVSGLRYPLDNEYFLPADAALLHGMLRRSPPARVIEIGSGYTSALMLDVDERFLGGRTRFRFIDPHPERLLGLVREDDRASVEVIESPVQEVDLALFAELRAGDILFVDSSHVAKTGSDVGWILSEALPCLADGVLVHFHDIFWPFEYPREWLEAGRAWNEAYLLRAFLQYNRAFRIVLWGSWLEAHHRGELERALPEVARRFPTGPIGSSSLWLRKVAAAGD
jgi:hypothetical protein